MVALPWYTPRHRWEGGKWSLGSLVYCDPIPFCKERVDVTNNLDEEGCPFSPGLMELPCVSSNARFKCSTREPHLATSIHSWCTFLRKIWQKTLPFFVMGTAEMLNLLEKTCVFSFFPFSSSQLWKISAVQRPRLHIKLSFWLGSVHRKMVNIDRNIILEKPPRCDSRGNPHPRTVQSDQWL